MQIMLDFDRNSNLKQDEKKAIRTERIVAVASAGFSAGQTERAKVLLVLCHKVALRL